MKGSDLYSVKVVSFQIQLESHCSCLQHRPCYSPEADAASLAREQIILSWRSTPPSGWTHPRSSRQPMRDAGPGGRRRRPCRHGTRASPKLRQVEERVLVVYQHLLHRGSNLRVLQLSHPDNVPVRGYYYRFETVGQALRLFILRRADSTCSTLGY